jgi:hypothetical protein
MENMDNVTEKKASIKLGGEEREIHFGMKAWKQIEDEYGSVMDIGEVLKALLEGIMAALYDTAPEGKKRGNPQKSKAAK